MSVQFGPMHSSQDGIDRLELRIPIQVSRQDIVYIFAQFFEERDRPTKHEIYGKVIQFLAQHGHDGLAKPPNSPAYRWQKRLSWADYYISYMFRGWSK